MMREAPVIMLVDDDLDFLEINRYVLEARGYRILCFSDPEKALERLALDKPDLVITDLMMNRLDSGFSLSQRIKDDSRFGDIPVVIVTAIGSRRGLDLSPRTAEELAAMHAEAYFEKPLEPETLLAKVEELVERGVEEGLT
jgi:CheY-like chemotaxis protein